MSATQTITIELPRTVIDAAIMKRLDIVAPLPAALATSAANDLPAIGAAYEGGIYAGITLDGDKPAALVVLPGDFEGNWKDAQAWAQQQGGELPSRIDGLVLLKNVKSEFREAYYWTNAQRASSLATPGCRASTTAFSTTATSSATFERAPSADFPFSHSTIQ